MENVVVGKECAELKNQVDSRLKLANTKCSCYEFNQKNRVSFCNRTADNTNNLNECNIKYLEMLNTVYTTFF